MARVLKWRKKTPRTGMLRGCVHAIRQLETGEIDGEREGLWRLTEGALPGLCADTDYRSGW